MKVVIGGRSKLTRRVVPLAKGGFPRGRDPHLDEATRRLAARAVKEGLFRGERGEVLPLVGARASDACCVLLGLGDAKKVDCEALRRAFGALAKRLSRMGGGRVGVGLSSLALRKALGKFGVESTVQAMTEGLHLGSYRYIEQKSEPGERRRKPTVAFEQGERSDADLSAARRGVRRGAVIADAVNGARNLANEPANQLYPEVLARRARSVAKAAGLRCRVLGPRELEKEKMGGVLGVGQGSARPPRLIILEHRPQRAKKTIVLVGKAVTFDTGGISIKPARGMEDMKFDMAGGAAVIGAMNALARIGPKARVIGLVPSAENHISGSALRPGDVIRSASGKTIEVINTDAEGRLLLADALHYSRRFRPDAVVDIATLTGACLVALGATAAGLMSNDDRLARTIADAAGITGERVWRLPLFDEYYEAVKSQVADLRNSSGRNAGASTAGAFLGHFMRDVPWAHVDIAGVGWSRRSAGYLVPGATGAGVRLLVEWALAEAGR